MKKRILCLLLIAAALFALFTVYATANPGDKKFTIVGVTKAPVQDGKISTAEYGGNEPIVMDGSGKNTDGTWANTKWDKEIIKYYYTWDKTNLYVGITVENDTTPSQNVPKPADNADPFGKCDMVQLGFNPAYEMKGCVPVLFGVGFTADGQPTVRGEAFRSTEDGKQTLDITNLIKGYSTKYSAAGINYQTEIVIPWNTIFVKGVGRTSDGAPLYDLTKYKAQNGFECGIFLVYCDNNGSSTNIYIRSDSTTGNEWKAEKMSTLAIVLKDPPAAETTKAAATSTAKTASAPQTADMSALYSISGSALSCAGLITLIKLLKKKH